MTTQNLELDLLETVELDDEGYLIEAHDWKPRLAEAIAGVLGIDLTDKHWTVIRYARDVHAQTGEAPTLRQIVQNTDVTMKEMYQLFPGGPAKYAAMIAGLKKPTGCI
ncbi:MAG TPA: TusE/DsrC/DsvC family sulfur relay protein [Anaerolineales bacterium]|nr:TusE/DsrC/DsvC family sulfur relay protein [Anaerolineales bacterium]